MLALAMALAIVVLRLAYLVTSWPSVSGVDDVVVLADVQSEIGESYIPEDLVENWLGHGASTVSPAAAFNLDRLVIQRAEQVLAVDVGSVDPAFFAVFDLRPLWGRLLAAEDRQSSAAVAVISRRLFDLLGGQSSLIGTFVRLGGDPVQIVGVLAGTPWFPSPTIDVWMPLPRYDPAHPTDISLVARLAPGMSVAHVQDEIAVAVKDLAPSGARATRPQIVVRTLAESVNDPFVVPLRLLVAGALLLSAIAIWNSSGLLYQIGMARLPEFGTRLALGASHARLAFQFAIENAIVTMVGVSIGALLAAMLLNGLALTRIPIGFLQSRVLSFDSIAALFTAAVAAVCLLVIGIIPVTLLMPEVELKGVNIAPSAGLAGRERTLTWLTCLQSALAVAVLASALALAVGFWRLTRVDPGYVSSDVVVGNLRLPGGERYAERLSEASRDVRRVLNALPGVEAVGFGNMLPFSESQYASEFKLPVELSATTRAVRAAEYRVSVGYIEALGMRVVAGRSFSREDEAASSGTAIVNEEFVRRYLRTGDIIGLTLPKGLGSVGVPVKIIGIVAPVLRGGLQGTPSADVYILVPETSNAFRRDASLVLRGRNIDPGTVKKVVESSVGSSVLDHPALLEARVQESVWLPKAASMVAVTFGSVAVTFAIIAVFSQVTHRTLTLRRDIAVRMACGAAPDALRRSVATRGLVPAMIGAVGGVPVAAAVAGFGGRYLYGYRLEADAVGSAVVLVLVACAVCGWVAARHVLNISPAELLRNG